MVISHVVSAMGDNLGVVIVDNQEINVTIDELQGIADRLQKASRATEASIRAEWCEDRKGLAS